MITFKIWSLFFKFGNYKVKKNAVYFVSVLSLYCFCFVWEC